MTRRREGVEWSCPLAGCWFISLDSAKTSHWSLAVSPHGPILDRRHGNSESPQSFIPSSSTYPGNFELINYQAAAMGRNKFLEPSHLSPPLSLSTDCLNIFATLWEIFLSTIHAQQQLTNLKSRNAATGFVLLVCCCCSRNRWIWLI